MKNSDMMALLEKSPFEVDCGEIIGRDPRKISADEFNEYLSSAPTGMKAIRAKCMDCAGGEYSEVRKCVCTSCPLWPLRMGSKPVGLREARGEKIKDAGEKE